MLQLDNRTPYHAERAVLLDLDGSELWVLAVKGTFDIVDGRTIPSPTQHPVCLVDEYYGEPGISSLRYESELVFRKPGTDVVLNGQAHAPGGRPASAMDVEIRAAGMRKSIRVIGDRRWKQSGTGLAMTQPEPFLTIPMVYERAFGGTDVTSGDEAHQGAEFRNPIGTGFATKKSHLHGQRLPNLEDPAELISSWNSRPAPVGTGFIGKHWEPRRRYAGTCDQNYVDTRLPLYPLDFDTRFFLGASRDLVCTPHLRGGEPVEIRGMTPSGHLAFTLPRVVLGFQTRLNGAWVDHRATLGSVVIEPGVPRVMLTWHTALPCHRQTFGLERTRIYEKRWQ